MKTDNFEEEKAAIMSEAERILAQKEAKSDCGASGDISAQEDSAAQNAQEQAAQNAQEQAAKNAQAAQALYSEQAEGLEAQYNKLKEDYLRANADFANFKTRLEREKQQAIEYANAEFAKALLPVLDAFSAACLVETQSEEAQSLKSGLNSISSLLESSLAKFGVKEIAADPGTAFDPNKHEAMMLQESPDFEPNTVLVKYRKGYIHKDRILRAAQVVVSK